MDEKFSVYIPEHVLWCFNAFVAGYAVATVLVRWQPCSCGGWHEPDGGVCVAVSHRCSGVRRVLCGALPDVRRAGVAVMSESEEKMRSALEGLLTQVYQMQGMFDDSDGTIARAIADAEEALSPAEEEPALRCSMGGCKHPVTHMDAKGWPFCTEHGNARKSFRRCRKLRPYELTRLESGGTITY